MSVTALQQPSDHGLFNPRDPDVNLTTAASPDDQPDENVNAVAPAAEDGDGSGHAEQQVANGDGSSGAGLQPKDAEIKHFADIRPTLQRFLAGQDYAFLQMIEQKTQLDREKIFYGICAVFALYMVAGPGAGLLCNLIAIAYPAFQSVVAIRSVAKDDDTQWLVYWTTYGCFSLLDFFAENFNHVFPFYWLAKLCFLLYLALPQTNGAHNVYVNYVDPAFDKLQPLAKNIYRRVSSLFGSRQQ